jgi:glycosyltransferase involved in cell wall biosynthesis
VRFPSREPTIYFSPLDRVGSYADPGRDRCIERLEGHDVRIAHILTRMYPLGGAQIHVRDLAVDLQARGHLCTVLTSGGGPLVDDLRAQGIATIILRHMSVPIGPIRDLRALREIRSALIALRPDLAVAHMSKAGVLTRLAGRPLGIPVVFTAHGWAFTPGVPAFRAAVYRQIERFVGHLASKIITVSEFDRRLAVEAGIVGEDRVVTVHNGVADVPPQLRADPSRTPPRLVMAARFDSPKDHTTLVRALAGLQDLVWELELIGDGQLKSPAESLVARLGIADRVRFAGQRTDVDRFLAQAQISLLVTNWEGFPRSILEAMRAGLPVVASSVGGIDESVRDGETGYLVPRGDVELLRDRIRRLVTTPALRVRMGNAGRLRYQQHFTLDHAVTKTLDVYRQVVTLGTS